MDKIIIDLKKFLESGLDLLEYLALLKAYHYSISKIDLSLNIPIETLIKLQDQGLIKIGSNGIFIREEGLKLFEDKRDKYYQKFFDLFPKKVPNTRGGSRILSPVDIGSHISQEAYKKWRVLTKNDVELKEKIIACLNIEIETRKKSGDLAYMHNIVTWLNQRNWQMYEDKLTEVIKTNISERPI